MGRRHNEVASEEKIVPYDVVGGPEDYVKVKVGDKEFTPPEISATVLRSLKESAESYLGHKVNRRSLQCRHTSTTLSGRPRKTLVRFPARGHANHQ